MWHRNECSIMGRICDWPMYFCIFERLSLEPSCWTLGTCFFWATLEIIVWLQQTWADWKQDCIKNRARSSSERARTQYFVLARFLNKPHPDVMKRPALWNLVNVLQASTFHTLHTCNPLTIWVCFNAFRAVREATVPFYPKLLRTWCILHLITLIRACVLFLKMLRSMARCGLISNLRLNYCVEQL